MDEKFLIANILVPDNEVWVSPKTFENPFSKSITEAQPKTPNMQSKPCCQAVRLLNKNVSSAIWRCPVCFAEV